MPATIDYKALRDRLCQFLPKATESAERPSDSTGRAGIIDVMSVVADSGEAILRINHHGSGATSGKANLDVPLAFAFGEIKLADLLTASNHHHMRLIIARAVAYIENEYLGGKSTEPT